MLNVVLIKPIGSTIGRCWMVRRMRKTLLGKYTLHGRSQVVVKALAEHSLKVKRAKGGSKHSILTMDHEEKAQEAFGLTEEERFAVGDELLMSVLNFRLLTKKQMKHIRFFTMVVLLQLFVALPVRKTGLQGSVDDPSFGSPLPPESLVQQYGESSIYRVFEIFAEDLNMSNSIAIYGLHQQSVWMYVAPVNKYLSDQALRSFVASNSNATYLLNCKRTGWAQPANLDKGGKFGMGLVIVVAVFMSLLLVKKIRGSVVKRSRVIWQVIRLSVRRDVARTVTVAEPVAAAADAV